MELTTQQYEQIRAWLSAGATLSDVQKSLKSEYGITMTYMDLRMLVLEIGAAVQDKPEPVKPALPPDNTQEAEEEDPYAEEFDDESPGGALDNDPTADRVVVSIDRVVRPGAMVSGEVTFSNGEKGKWLIDNYGRFGLDPDTPGYKPTEVDLMHFQNKLRSELRRHGYG